MLWLDGYIQQERYQRSVWCCWSSLWVIILISFSILCCCLGFLKKMIIYVLDRHTYSERGLDTQKEEKRETPQTNIQRERESIISLGSLPNQPILSQEQKTPSSGYSTWGHRDITIWATIYCFSRLVSGKMNWVRCFSDMWASQSITELALLPVLRLCLIFFFFFFLTTCSSFRTGGKELKRERERELFI